MILVFGIFAICAGVAKFDALANGYSFIGSIIVFAIILLTRKFPKLVNIKVLLN